MLSISGCSDGRDAVPPVSVPQEERVELRFSVTREVFEEFEALRNGLSNTLGHDLSLEAVFSKLIRIQRTKNRRKRNVMPKTARPIPTSVKREVQQRDHGQCTYASSEGIRCNEKRYLEFDHVVPFANGGTSDASNVRLLCRGHNQLCAENVFGKAKVQYYANFHPQKSPRVVYHSPHKE